MVKKQEDGGDFAGNKEALKMWADTYSGVSKMWDESHSKLVKPWIEFMGEMSEKTNELSMNGAAEKL